MIFWMRIPHFIQTKTCIDPRWLHNTNMITLFLVSVIIINSTVETLTISNKYCVENNWKAWSEHRGCNGG